MARTSSEKAAEYDRRFPDSLPPERFDQKVERVERLDLKRRKADGGRGVRFFGVPPLPWHKDD